MNESTAGGCRLVRSEATYAGAQGFTYHRGITAATVGARAISLTMPVIPPGARNRAHLHRGIETAVYVIDGQCDTLYGPRLEHCITARAGDYLYIAPGTPHVVVNRSDRECRAVVAHSGPDDQVGIVLLPELDGMPDAPGPAPPRA